MPRPPPRAMLSDMQDFGFALMTAGYLTVLAGYFWMVRLLFRRSPVLGCASLLTGVVVIYLLITSPRTTWRQSLLILAGLAGIIAGYRVYNA